MQGGPEIRARIARESTGGPVVAASENGILDSAGGRRPWLAALRDGRSSRPGREAAESL